MFRKAIPSVLVASTRRFHASPLARKSMKEEVGKVAHEVNMKVGSLRGLASAIEKGEEITDAAREKLGSASEKTKTNVDHAAKVGREKTNQAAAGAREAKRGVQNELDK